MICDPQGPPGGDTGGVKKTSPMKGRVFFTGDTHTDIHTDGYRDSMTESAQWADSVKSTALETVIPKIEHLGTVLSFYCCDFI